MRDINEVLAEGRQQGANWRAWFKKLKEGLRSEGPSGSGKYTRKEINDYLDKVERDEVQVDKGVLRNVIESLEKVVLWNKRKITEDDIGDMKIAQEVKLTDEARSPDFNWRDVTVWLKPLKADPESQKEAEWFETLLETARSVEALEVQRYILGRKFDPFAKVNLRKFKGRAAYYNHWETVSSHYDKKMHVKFLEALKKDVDPQATLRKDGKKTDTTLHSVIDSLIKTPAPKIHITTKPIPMSGLDKELAVLDAFLDRMGNVEDNALFSVTESITTDAEGGTSTTIEVGDKSNMTRDEMDRQGDAQSKLADEAEQLGEQIEDLTTSKIDPLLYIAVEQGKVPVAFDAKDFDADRFTNKDMKRLLVQIDSEAWEEFKEFIAELDESVEKDETGLSLSRDKYYLPIKDVKEEWRSLSSKQGFGITERILVKPGSEQWTRFFEDLGNLLYEVPRRFSIKQAGARVGFGSKSGSKDRGAEAAINRMRSATQVSFPQERPPEGGEYLLSMTPTTQSLFEDLMQKIMAYYIEPSGSQYYYEGKPRYTEISQFSNLIMDSEQTKMRKRYQRIKEGNVDNFGADDLEPISDFIEAAQNPLQKIGKKGGLLRAGKQALRGINAVLGEDEDNKQFIGDVLYQIASYQAADTDNIPFEGESLTDWNEMEENSPNQVLHDIHEFMESTPIKTNLNLRDTSKPIEESRVIEGETGGGKLGQGVVRKKYEAVKRLITLITELKKSEIDPIAMKLLHAHDKIRKMAGKKLSYARLNVDDPNHISKVMDDVSVTAPEILRIVKSYDSHRNLSLKHGISENEVYMIKGMFR